jgi:preprotein translocase subunit YajC
MEPISVLVLAGLIVVMIFFVIRPQQKKKREAREMIASLKVGDSIITIEGIKGKISKVRESTLVLSLGELHVSFEIEKWAVSRIE